MFDLKTITRANIVNLTAYSSARDEFTGSEGLFLDANENPYGELNRYPDPHQTELKREIAKVKNENPSNIFIGNGSDEIIDLLFRIFCEPGKDSALTFSPTYGMYDVAAAINNIELIKIPLNSGFQINEASLKEYLVNPKLKLILICSPNNPTGNLIDSSVIERIASSFNGIVLIDEAYIEFSESNSCIGLLSIYPNLIISQTFSKARGLAAARIGLAYSNPNIINLLNRVKPPYNVSTLNQQAAIEAIGDLDKFEKNKAQILKNKKILSDALNQVRIVEKVYPSEANFFLIKTRNANAVYNALVQQKIIIRNRNNVIENCLRITVGTKQENNSLVEALKLM